MRYKQQIVDYYTKFKDEERLVEHKKQNYGDQSHTFFDSMDEKSFKRMLNTFAWLNNYLYPGSGPGVPIRKPSNNEIVEAMDKMELEGEQLLAFGESKAKGDPMKPTIRKMGKGRTDCAAYYRSLAEEDFFAEKKG